MIAVAVGLVAVLAAVPVDITPVSAAGDPVLMAVGDIACDPSDANYNGGSGTASFCRHAATAALLGGADVITPLGDLQYSDGQLTKFQQSYDSSWGATKPLQRPVQGNHESAPTGYYDYFGPTAGERGKGYYSYDVGAWHVIALNAQCALVIGGCDAGSPQETWLASDLATHPADCTLAYWHQPRFTSSNSSAVSTYGAFWADLYAAGADVVLNGHSHNYERFAPQNPAGQAAADGIRQFVVGTGGKDLVGFGATPMPNSEVRNSDTYGLLRLTLHAGSYDWQFVPEAGRTFADSGGAACTPRAAPSASPSPPPPSSPPTASPSDSPSPTATSPPPSPTSPPPSATPSPSASTQPACDPPVRVSASEVTIGQPVDIDVSGLVPGRAVSLEGYARPSTTYAQLRAPTQPADDGTVRFTVRPTTNTRLRVRVAGCTQDASSRVLVVHPVLSLRATRAGPRQYTFAGAIVPGRQNAGRLVALYYQATGGAKVRRGVLTVGSDGTYRLGVTFSGSARLTFFVQTGSNVVNADATSNRLSLLVY